MAHKGRKRPAADPNAPESLVHVCCECNGEITWKWDEDPCKREPYCFELRYGGRGKWQWYYLHAKCQDNVDPGTGQTAVLEHEGDASSESDVSVVVIEDGDDGGHGTAARLPELIDLTDSQSPA